MAGEGLSRQVELDQEEIELVCYLAKFFRGMCILQNGGGAIVNRTAALNDRMESLLFTPSRKELSLSSPIAEKKRAEKGAVAAGAAPALDRGRV